MRAASRSESYRMNLHCFGKPSLFLPMRLSVVGSVMVGIASFTTIGVILREIESDITQNASAVLKTKLYLTWRFNNDCVTARV